MKEKWQNSSVSYKRDKVSLAWGKVAGQKCFSEHFSRWFVPDELRIIIPKETSNNAGAKSPKISSIEVRVLQLGWMMLCGYCNYIAHADANETDILGNFSRWK